MHNCVADLRNVLLNNKKMKKVFLLTAMAVPLFLASCGNNNTSTDESSTDTSQTVVEDVVSDVAAENTFEITANDQLKFSVEKIEVKAGEKIRVTLKNVGTVPKEAMGHDFIVLKPGTDVEAYAAKAAESKATDYVPASELSSIVAHTRMLGPGEEDTIEFTVPAGEYDFICGFPGHYFSMRGKLIAK